MRYREGKELGQDLGSGIKDALAWHPTDVQQAGRGGDRNRQGYRAVQGAVQPASAGNSGPTAVDGGQNSRISTPVSGPDWCSYYGALPEKKAPSNYMPITSDFSKFGR